MRFASVGSDSTLQRRERALAGLPGYIGSVEPEELRSALEKVDVLFIGVPVGERFAMAAEATRLGVRAFLEWPPSVSLRECADLVELAQEAGLEAGVSRPLRFLDSLSGLDRAHVISMRMASSRRNLLHELSDLVDAASMLAGTSSVQRIDAETVASNELNPITAFSLRFDNGSYAQGLVYGSGSSSSLSLLAAGRSNHVVEQIDLDVDLERAIARETQQFLDALEGGSRIPVSAHDALQTMRIVERLMGNLR